MAAYAGWVTLSASRLRTELASLRESNGRLQENHRRMRQEFVQLVSHPGTGEEAFRKLIAVLEAEDGAGILIPSDPGTTRINKASGIQIR